MTTYSGLQMTEEVIQRRQEFKLQLGFHAPQEDGSKLKLELLTPVSYNWSK